MTDISISKNVLERLKKQSKVEFRQYKKSFFKHESVELLIVLKSHLFIERLINEIIENLFTKSGKLTEKKFSDKVDILSALDILFPKTEKGIRIFNKIRNDFSHNREYKIDSKIALELRSILDTKTFQNNSVLLSRSSDYLIGGLQFLRNYTKHYPFMAVVIAEDKIFKRDKLYKITKRSIKEMAPDTDIESWKFT